MKKRVKTLMSITPDLYFRTITCTPDHPFLTCRVIDGKPLVQKLTEPVWKEAKDINVEEDLLCIPLTGRKGTIGWWLDTRNILFVRGNNYSTDGCVWIRPRKICVEQLAHKEDVYNLTVEDDSSYVVNGIAVHNCGVIISSEKIQKIIPEAIVGPKDNKARVTQVTMTECEDLGLLKMDFLGLRTMTVIQKSLAEKVMALSNYYGREAIYFNPTDPDCPSFNPLYGDETEVIENIVTTFLMLSKGSSQYFLDMADIFLRKALKVVKRVKGDKATMNDLSILAHNSQSMGKEMVNELSRMGAPSTEMKKENDEVVSWFLTEYYNEKSKTYEHCSGVRNQIFKINANEHLRRVLNPPEGGSDMDFSRVLEEGGVLAISTAQGDLRELGKYLGYFIILNLQSAVFKRSGNENTRRPHFLYIDEFQTYSNPGFSDMLTQGRSYKVSSNLATQNRALIGMGAGRDGQNFIELVSTNARNVILFPGGNSKDAKYYSEEFGEEERMRVQKSVSRPRFFLLNLGSGWGNVSEREMTQMEASFSPSDIIYRQFGEIIYKIIQNNTLQPPGIGKVSWIDKHLNDKLDTMIAEHKDRQDKKRNLLEKVKSQNISNYQVTNSDPFADGKDEDKETGAEDDLRSRIIEHQGATSDMPPEENSLDDTRSEHVDVVNDLPIEDDFC